MQLQPPINSHKRIQQSTYENKRPFMMLQKTLTLYMKRSIILDRLISTCKMYNLNTPAMKIARSALLDTMKSEDFYINSFFNKDSLQDTIQGDLDFIIKRITEGTKYTLYN